MCPFSDLLKNRLFLAHSVLPRISSIFKKKQLNVATAIKYVQHLCFEYLDLFGHKNLSSLHLISFFWSDVRFFFSSSNFLSQANHVDIKKKIKHSKEKAIEKYLLRYLIFFQGKIDNEC